MTDINLGIYTAKLDPGKCITATSERLAIRRHNFENVRFKDFVRGLLSADLRRREEEEIPQPHRPRDPGPSASGEKLSVARLFERLNEFLRDDTIVVADV